MVIRTQNVSVAVFDRDDLSGQVPQQEENMPNLILNKICVLLFQEGL